MSKGKSRSALGVNPLSQGIFSKTVSPETSEVKGFNDQELQNQESGNQESSLLKNSSTQQPEESAPQSQPNPKKTKSARSTAKKSRKDNQESIKNNQEPSFLTQESVERVNLRLSVEINDWLDTLLKQGKRTHGRKIPKETWVQAALEFFRALPVDWQTVDSEESLRQVLTDLESRLNNKD